MRSAGHAMWESVGTLRGYGTQTWQGRRGIIMAEYKLGEIEMRFADIIWENEPIASGELTKLCEAQLRWKKSTTYTVLKRLCERGIFRNEAGVVTSVLSKEQFRMNQSREFVEESFAGSLPAFVAAFVSHSKLSEEEITELRRIIEESR